MTQNRTLLLPHDVNGGVVARRFIREFAADHDLDAAAGDECLIGSELVANAFSYGGPPMELALQYADDEVTIEVSDGDPRTGQVRIRAVDQPHPGGRGLRIVASLAKRWGTRPFRSGKKVWATTDATRVKPSI
jgi:anti-sigma regulatory factor (Ser/Thr protein kinase)